MAKLKRTVIGSFVKSKDPTKPPYIKVKAGITLKEGEYLRVENTKFQLDSLAAGLAAGRLSEETAASIKERLDKTPDFVIAEVLVLRAE